MPTTPSPVEVVVDDPAWAACDLDALANAAAAATLRAMGIDPGACEIALLACDDARISGLNAEFRGKPAPTNVLSWPSEDRAPDMPGARPAPPRDPELGDIALAFGVCSREAAAEGKPLDAHVTHLVVHAVLHLLGYDHEDARDAALMESIEVEILAQMGLPDPYSPPAAAAAATG